MLLLPVEKKRTKPGDLPTKCAVSEIEKFWKEKYFQNKTNSLLQGC
jgi:hypothetical protein